MNRATEVSPEQTYHNNKNRKFLIFALVLIGIIVFIAGLFLIIIIYKTLKSGTTKSNLTTFESNLTEFNHNRSDRTCLYGIQKCDYGATCTEEDECRCIFNCSDSGEFVQEKMANKSSNQCQLDRARCETYYEKNDLTCSSTICSHGAKCKTGDNGLPRCYCPHNCDEYARTTSSEGSICGSDQRTYSTICELKKRSCDIQQDLHVAHLGQCQQCQNSSCNLNNQKCDPYADCSAKYQPLCASNLHNYSSECEMQKYACQGNINLTKLHDRTCSSQEQQQLREVCKTLNCSNGKSCMFENGSGVCRCLLNCSFDRKQVCASNGLLYRNQCEMERDRCLLGENFTSVDIQNCMSTCGITHCPYGQCKQPSKNRIECVCKQCSATYSDQESICGDNGVTYPSKCLLEHEACTRQIFVKPRHMGQCNNCQNVVCQFYGQCQSEQGNYSCICPSRHSCPPKKNNSSYAICGSNQELFYSQCEMEIRSCELQTHLYTVAPHYCAKDRNQTEYTVECGYDEPRLDSKLNRPLECEAFERCPINSYCNKQTNRCCVKVLTAILPYRMCLSDGHCGRNMICSNGLCQCERNNLIPARKKRECSTLLPDVSVNTNCKTSQFGCCRDNITTSLTFDRRGCPEYCNCHRTGSLRSFCDHETGACYCRPAVGGLTCSYCENEYWAFSRILTHNNTGCTPCGCHPLGSMRKDCSQDTGQCSCHSFATGLQCDQCIDTSSILTDSGCVNLNKHRRRRPRTCQDLRCLYDGICEMSNGQPHCTCDHLTCTKEEQRLIDTCASDGRTYKSRCDIKRQQCIKQYELVLTYLGVCHGNGEDLPIEENVILDEAYQMMPIDSKRCITDMDCGENMVCLSEFCECAKQKYKRIPGPRCVIPQSIYSELNTSTHLLRRQPNGHCTVYNPCENRGLCQNQPNGSYTCLCTFGWSGQHCDEKIDITLPYFNQQSYLQIRPSETIKHIDITFAAEHPNGLLFYCDDQATEFYFVIAIRNRIIDITIRSVRFISTIQLSTKIDLNTYVRLQIHLLYNEIQAKLDNRNVSSRLLPFETSLKSTLYLGGLPDSFQSSHQQFDVSEGFQGCIHELSLNGQRTMFNNSEYIAQNIHECMSNPCQSVSCRHANRCVPIRNNDAYSYKCLNNDDASIDRCLTKPCRNYQQCINVYPNSHLCLCLNCSNGTQHSIGFHSTSYIKHVSLQPFEDTGRFKIELWFLSESSSGLLIYSEHINPKKGHIKLYIQRRILIFYVLIGSKSISLSSRHSIELNKWHRCIIDISGQNLTMILDQYSPITSSELFMTNALWPRSFTFIGYLPIQYRSANSYIFEGFRGAIQKVILNNHSSNDIRQNSIELFNITEFYGSPCQSYPCTMTRPCHPAESNNYTCIEQFRQNDISLELDGTTNAVYPYTASNLHRNYFDLALKTKYSSGLIFYIGDTSLSFFSKYLSLTLIHGFLQFEAKLNINSSSITLKSKVRIDDGRWHRIEIQRYRRRIIMKLDDDHHNQTASLGKQIEFHPNPSYIYIGGYNRLCSYDEQHCRSYRGCLKNFLIDDNYLHLINDEINQHRLLKQCHDFI